MNCIFVCIFNQEKYVEMFYLLLESIFTYGKLDDNTKILIYTSSKFMNIIKQNNLFDDKKINFEVNDTYNNVNLACRARLEIFNLKSIDKYNKILYLDIDIIIKDDINKIFDVIEDDILYVVEEGSIDNINNYWGKVLFGNEINNYNDKTAFTSGILLFRNCEKIKILFSRIREDINIRSNECILNDQPHIIYNCFKYNMYNNKILKHYAVNNDHNIHSNKIIHHFSGCPGFYKHKIRDMKYFLNNYKKIFPK